MSKLIQNNQEASKKQKVSPYRYVRVGNKWQRVTNDDMGRIFQGFTIAPQSYSYEHIPERYKSQPSYTSSFNGNLNIDYNTISNGLDLIPIVGGLNRLARGEVGKGLIDLGLDALGPFKYAGKGIKYLPKLKSIIKSSKFEKKYDKFVDEVYETVNNAIANGKTREQMSGLINAAQKYANKSTNIYYKIDDAKKGIKGLSKFIVTSSIKPILNNNNNRVTAADIIHNSNGNNALETIGDFFKLIPESYKSPYNKMNTSDDPGDSFLLDDNAQEQFMKRLGFFKTSDDDGIKMIEKATNALTSFRLGRKPNIYQIGEDLVPRDSVIPVSYNSISNNMEGLGIYLPSHSLNHAGNYPTIYYKHKNPNIKTIYARDIDLNDYGKHHDTSGITYGPNQILADIYDFVGNPFIQKTGLYPIGVVTDNQHYKSKHTINEGNKIISNKK